MTHAHFDLAAAEQQIRATIAASAEASDQLVAEGKVDPELAAAQKEFDESRLQFTLALLRAENAGIDRNKMLASAGFALGQIWSSTLMGTVGTSERGVLNGWVYQALAQSLGAEPAMKTMEAVLRPMEAGNA